MKVNEEALFWGTVAPALAIVNSHRPPVVVCKLFELVIIVLGQEDKAFLY